ncbi:MAG: response regulator [Spirochaetaceae bacterium]|jgi:putative two-component system response regulator|nr:response regulator [Spirochaetaceae bacterium]
MNDAKAKIVLVDDDITSLTLGKNILAEKYDIITIPSGEKLFKLLDKIRPSLILLDVEMPEMNGYEVLGELKSNERDANIPVIFLTSKSDPVSELEGLNLGAIDYISKPFSPPLLLKRLEVHLLVEFQKQKLIDFNNNLQEMVRAKTKTVLDMQNSVLRTVANMVENRDEETGSHIERTQDYLRILLDAMYSKGVRKNEIVSWDRDFFLQSSQLHDVGKISIKDSILLKPGKLDAVEFEEMKKHTIYGVRIIEEIEKNTPESSFLFYAKIFAGTHHEKWDGTGYPNKLEGEAIPLMGRLMAIADVYDALISERPYKPPFSHEETVKIIRQGKGGQFDPSLTDLFLSVADQFYEIVTERKKNS